jgi:hypothetical protein
VSKQTRYLGYIAQAEGHVHRGREIVLRQRKLIAHLGAQGSDGRVAKELLGAFERSLKVFEDDLAEFETALASHLDDVKFNEEVKDELMRHREM